MRRIMRHTVQEPREAFMNKKTIALIAHDNKKAEMVSWAMKNREILSTACLCPTLRSSN